MKKNLLVLIFLFTALFVFQKSVGAQQLYFCEGVSDKGAPIGKSSTFNIPSGGGYFYFLVKLNYEVGCNYVDYILYKENSRGQMVYNTTISQDGMENSWTWFWKKVTFYDAGYYRVDVVDCSSTTIASSYLTINFQ
jgi:hypothetical protein